MIKIIDAKHIEVTLETPIKRAGEEITTIIVKQPTGRSLGNNSQTEVLQQNARALSKVIPKITEPMIQEDEFLRLPVSDTALLGAAVSAFFMTGAQRLMMVAEIQAAYAPMEDTE